MYVCICHLRDSKKIFLASKDKNKVLKAMTMILTIALKGAVRDFYSVLTAPRIVSSTQTQVAKALSCANHVQNTERLSRATCHMPRGKKGQVSY